MSENEGVAMADDGNFIKKSPSGVPCGNADRGHSTAVMTPYSLLTPILTTPQPLVPTAGGGAGPPPRSRANCCGGGVPMYLDAHPPHQAICTSSCALLP